MVIGLMENTGRLVTGGGRELGHIRHRMGARDVLCPVRILSHVPSKQPNEVPLFRKERNGDSEAHHKLGQSQRPGASKGHYCNHRILLLPQRIDQKGPGSRAQCAGHACAGLCVLQEMTRGGPSCPRPLLWHWTTGLREAGPGGCS